MGGSTTTKDAACKPMTMTDPCFEKCHENCTVDDCTKMGNIGCSGRPCSLMEMKNMSHCMTNTSVPLKCSKCDHVYDPKQDCGGKANPKKDCGQGVDFEALPADWKCPVCGADKTHFQPQTMQDGTVKWIENSYDDSA